MAWYRVGGGGLPNSVKTDMNNVLNKKLGTSTTYPVNDWANEVNLLGMLEEKTASGAIVTFSDGADEVPLKKCEITLPASLDGYSEIDVVHTGKNLVDGTGFTRGLPSTTIGASIDTITASTRYAYFGTAIKGGNYTVSSVSNDTDYYNAILIFGYTNGVLSFYTNAAANDSKTVDLSACDYARIAIGSRTVQITVPTDFTDYGTIQFEVGSTATTYEPYTAPTTHTASLGRTIYGGQVDIVNGEGESTHAKYVVTGQETGDFLAGTNNNGNRIGIRISGAQTPLYSGGVSNIGENKPNLASSSWTIGSWCIYTDNRLYFVVPNEYTTFATALQYLLDNNATFVYPLATPETFTFDGITPTPETALGVNNFWADDGDSSVTYRSQGTAYPLPATLISKTITQNGTYSAEDDDADGYSEVTVNVPTGGEEIPFTHVFTAGTATDQYYTATEDGIYLAVGIRDQSIGCSINLPDGGTTLLTSSLLSNRAQMKVVQLTSGQRIHLYLYDSSHMRGGWIFKLNTSTPVLAYSNGYSSTSIPNHGTADKVLSVIALAPTTDNTTIWDKTMKCYVRGTYTVSNRYSWLRLMYGIDNEMPTISFSGGIGGQWLINLG